MDVVLVAILVVAAIYKAVRQRRQRRLLWALLIALGVGLADVGLHGYFYQRHDCGAKYNPDIGCMAVLPGVLVFLGIAALIAVTLLSIIILLRSTPAAPPSKK